MIKVEDGSKMEAKMKDGSQNEMQGWTQDEFQDGLAVAVVVVVVVVVATCCMCIEILVRLLQNYL